MAEDPFMLQLPTEIELIRVADDFPVVATIKRLTRSLAQEKIDGTWWEVAGVSRSKRQLENDNHWRWAKKIGELRNSRWHEALAAQTEDDYVQGAILYRLDTYSFIEAEQGAIYIEGLATAPHNRPWLVDSARYRGVGENLLVRAVAHSYSLGFGGRINLLAFDNERTVSFYEKRGLTLVGFDDEGLPQFELEPEAAVHWLREQGYDL